MRGIICAGWVPCSRIPLGEIGARRGLKCQTRRDQYIVRSANLTSLCIESSGIGNLSEARFERSVNSDEDAYAKKDEQGKGNTGHAEEKAHIHLLGDVVGADVRSIQPQEQK